MRNFKLAAVALGAALFALSPTLSTQAVAHGKAPGKAAKVKAGKKKSGVHHRHAGKRAGRHHHHSKRMTRRRHNHAGKKPAGGTKPKKNGS
jgi:hypothetical protein